MAAYTNHPSTKLILQAGVNALNSAAFVIAYCFGGFYAQLADNVSFRQLAHLLRLYLDVDARQSGSTADLLHDVLPVNQSLNPATVRNHLHNIAKRQEAELEGKPDHLSGCPRDWGKLPKPGKPMVVSIDGGYVRNWEQKNTNFEIIAGKSFSKTQPF